MKRLLLPICFFFCGIGIRGQIPQVSPCAIHYLHRCDLDGYRILWNHWRSNSFTEQEDSLDRELEMANDRVYLDFYSVEDSWYIAGKVDTVYSTNIDSRNEERFVADGDPETSWVDNSKGGCAPRLIFTFSGLCPRITQISIFNGYVKSKNSWEEYGRAKRIKLYFDNIPIAILSLENSRTYQQFKVDTLGYYDKEHGPWTLSFEILDVYPGSNTSRVAISEITFDGIDYL